MKKAFFLGSVVLCFLLLASAAWGACHVITPTGSGSQSGSDWNNACAGFTGNCSSTGVVRGDTYYIAKGTYSAAPGLTKANSGTTKIIFKAPTAGDHCTDTGFAQATHVGQALMNRGMVVSSDNWVFDGQYGTEYSKGSYGFKIKDLTAAAFIINCNGGCANSTFRFIEIEGDNARGSCSGGDVGIYPGANGGSDNATIERNYIYRVNNHMKINGTLNVVVQNNLFTENYSGAACHGENIAMNATAGTIVRFNKFENCRGTACVAAGACGVCSLNTNTAFYGNIFYATSDYTSLDANPLSNGIFHTLGGSGWSGAVWYNNTVAGWTSSKGSGSSTFTDDGSGTNSNPTVRNTLFYGNNASMGMVGTCSNNAYFDQVRAAVCTSDQTGATGSPFVNFPANITQGQVPDFRLVNDTNSWFALSIPFNTDPDGVIRTSSRGAYQSTGPRPDPPSGLGAVVR